MKGAERSRQGSHALRRRCPCCKVLRKCVERADEAPGGHPRRPSWFTPRGGTGWLCGWCWLAGERPGARCPRGWQLWRDAVARLLADGRTVVRVTRDLELPGVLWVCLDGAQPERYEGEDAFALAAAWAADHAQLLGEPSFWADVPRDLARGAEARRFADRLGHLADRLGDPALARVFAAYCAWRDAAPLDVAAQRAACLAATDAEEAAMEHSGMRSGDLSWHARWAGFGLASLVRQRAHDPEDVFSAARMLRAARTDLERAESLLAAASAGAVAWRPLPPSSPIPVPSPCPAPEEPDADA